MKTLDEVIKVFTKCFDNTYNIVPLECEPEYGEDALQYLKWYKELADDSEAYAKWRENPPLTWDELKGMEGKPVWVEVKYHNPEATYKYWTIVKYFDGNEGGDMVFTGTGFYYKDLLGVDWQAYRKERG